MELDLGAIAVVIVGGVGLWAVRSVATRLRAIEKQISDIVALISRMDERQQAQERRHDHLESRIDEVDKRTDEHHDRIIVLEQGATA